MIEGRKKLKNKKMTNRLLKGLLFATAIGAMGISISLAGTKKVEAYDNGLVAEWFDTPAGQRTGIPPAYKVDSSFVNYNYYRRLRPSGNIYIFYYNDGINSFYSPVAKGQYQKYQPEIYSEEQIAENLQNYMESMDYPQDLVDRNYSNLKKSRLNVPAGYDPLSNNWRNYLTPSTNLITEGRYKGNRGQWRYIGYSTAGNSITDSIFPNDRKSGYTTLANYRFVVNPWNTGNPVAAFTKFDAPNYNATKTALVTQLMARYQQLYTNMARFVGNNRNAQISRAVSSFSMRNAPNQGTNVVFNGVQKGGVYYYTLETKGDNRNQRNLAVQKISVKDEEGHEIGLYTRNGSDFSTAQARGLVPGEKIKVDITVKNTSSYTTALNPTEILSGFAVDANASSTNQSITSNNCVAVKDLTSPGTVGAGRTKTFSTEYQVPNNGKFAVKAVVSTKHSGVGDNMNGADDSGKIMFDRIKASGNFTAKDIVLVDKAGKEVANAQPGQAYKVRYKYLYKGDNAVVNISAKLSYGITRTLPSKSSDGTSGFVSLNNFKPMNGQTYSFTTDDYITYETGVLTTNASITGGMSTSALVYNTNKADDGITKDFTGDYDIAVTDVKLVPTKTLDVTPGKLKYLVKYNVDYDVPDWVPNVEKDIEVKINVDGNIFTTTQHIKDGDNPNVSDVVEIPTLGGVKEIGTVVMVNWDAKVFESDYDNNTGKTTGKLEKTPSIKVPTKDNDTFTWKQYTQIHHWTGHKVDYPGLNTPNNYTFNDYDDGGDEDKTYQITENYNITHVWFRSKWTKDNKQGPKKDGWVDLITTTGKIKAGYGYEMMVDVQYDTDAFTKLPKAVLGLNGNWARPLLAGTNVPDNIYVQTPDKKIHSAFGNGGTQASFVGTRAGDDSKLNQRFVISPKSTLGVTTAGKFYIGSDVSNGSYKLSVFTPEITGLAGKMSSKVKEETTTLQDLKKDLKIEVVGSATDDINDHVTQ